VKKARRDFLKAGGSIAALQYLGGCSSIDEWVLKENVNDPNTVVILGAGLAGLTAAYTLKKMKVPYRLLEGSMRHGGRVWTVRDLNISSQHADMGGERIEESHRAIRSLAREMNVEINDMGGTESWAWYSGNGFLNSRTWQAEAGQLSRIFQNVSIEIYGQTMQILNLQNREQFPKAVLLDGITAEELLNRLKKELKPWMRPFLERMIRLQWGVEAKQISSLHLVHFMRDTFKRNQKYYKISGGSSSLTRALYERVSSVLPDKFVRFGYKLKAVRSYSEEEVFGTSKGWKLTFQTAKGDVTMKAAKVICTLPPPLLRDVEGWKSSVPEGTNLEPMDQQDLGNHSKIALSYKDRFWSKDKVLSSGGIWLTDLDSQAISMAGGPTSEGLAMLHGILQAEIGGPASISVGPHTALQMQKDLQKIDSHAGKPENQETMINWKLHSFSGGSRSFLKPGQFQLFDTKTVYNPESWLFAGDFRNLSSLGSMNAAVKSAVDAAEAIVSAVAKSKQQG
jgi:monoamine oxidase